MPEKAFRIARALRPEICPSSSCDQDFTVRSLRTSSPSTLPLTPNLLVPLPFPQILPAASCWVPRQSPDTGPTSGPTGANHVFSSFALGTIAAT